MYLSLQDSVSSIVTAKLDAPPFWREAQLPAVVHMQRGLPPLQTDLQVHTLVSSERVSWGPQQQHFYESARTCVQGSRKGANQVQPLWNAQSVGQCHARLRYDVTKEEMGVEGLHPGLSMVQVWAVTGSR